MAAFITPLIMGWSECGICKTEYSADTGKDEAPCTGSCGHTICCGCVRNLQIEALQGNRSGVRYMKCPYCCEIEAFDAHNIHASDALCFALAEKYDLLAEKYSLLAGRRTSSNSTSNTSRGGGDQQGRSHSRNTSTTNSSSSSRPGKRVKKEAERVTGSRQQHQVIELHEGDNDDEEEQEAESSYDRFDTDDVDDALDEDWKNESERDASVKVTNTNRSTTATSSVPASAQDLANQLNLPLFFCGKGVDGIASLSEKDSELPTRFQDIFHLMDFLFAPSHPKGTHYELLFMEGSLKRGGTKTRKWLRTFKKNNPTHKAVRWHQTKCQTWAPTNKTDLKAFVNLLNGLYQQRTCQERSMAQSRPYC